MKCQLQDCTNEATISITWRTNCMSAHAYWYQCRQCAGHTVRTFWDMQYRVHFSVSELNQRAIA